MKRGLLAALAAVLALAGIAIASNSEPRLVARAVLPADTFAPGPPSGNFIVAGLRPRPVRVAAGAGHQLGARRRARLVLGDGRQRLRREGELARLPAPRLQDQARLRDRVGRERDGRDRGLRPAPRPEREDPVRAHAAPTACSRAPTSTSSRCGSTATATSGSATSSGRGCCTPTPTASCWRRRSRSPASSRRRTRRSRPASRRRSAGARASRARRSRRTARRSIRCSRARSSPIPISSGGGSTSSTSARASTRASAGRTGSRPPSNAIGELTALDDKHFLVIERDNGQGPARRSSGSSSSTSRKVGADGYLVKREVVNLLDIADPRRDLAAGTTWRLRARRAVPFPFQTIESVLPLGGKRLLIANDNNYPFSAGRNAGRPDDNELIIVRTGWLK